MPTIAGIALLAYNRLAKLTVNLLALTQARAHISPLSLSLSLSLTAGENEKFRIFCAPRLGFFKWIFRWILGRTPPWDHHQWKEEILFYKRAVLSPKCTYFPPHLWRDNPANTVHSERYIELGYDQ